MGYPTKINKEPSSGIVLAEMTADQNGKPVPKRAAALPADPATERRVLQSARLATVGELASNIIHEVSNAMHAVKGYSELALMDPTNRETVELALKTAVEQVCNLDRQVRYVSFLLDAKEPTVETACLASLAHEATAFLQQLGRLNNCQIQIADDGEPYPIVCDRRQIHQLIVNLLLNAADATNGCGTIRVALERMFEVGMVELSVSDDGEGIAEELLDRIFEPFFSTKSRQRGSGLGLSLVQEVVRCHNGRLVVDSVPSNGSRFSVVFPVVSSL